MMAVASTLMNRRETLAPLLPTGLSRDHGIIFTLLQGGFIKKSEMAGFD
jgi:hypothetical protein